MSINWQNPAVDMPASRNARFQFPTDCSDTFSRRAASATLTSPGRIDNTILIFFSAGITGGHVMTIKLLRQVKSTSKNPCQES